MQAYSIGFQYCLLEKCFWERQNFYSYVFNLYLIFPDLQGDLAPPRTPSRRATMHKDSLGNSPGTEHKYAAAVHSREKSGTDGN